MSEKRGVSENDRPKGEKWMRRNKNKGKREDKRE